MEKKFFSIIIPVYNVQKYLAECIESVLSQNFSDYEIILVDDGSQDESGNICDCYKQNYPGSIKVYHKENQGLISARRAGLKLANGQYICFVDSDDCLKQGALNQLYAVIQNTGADVVFFLWERIDENSNLISGETPRVFENDGVINKTTVFEKILSTWDLNSLCTKCCKLELFDVDEDYSIYYRMQNGEDLLQSLPVLYNANSFYYLNVQLYQYRVNLLSITHQYREGQHRALGIVRPALYRYIEKLSLDNEDNKKAFFTMYLKLLWMDIEELFFKLDDRDKREDALDELKNSEFTVLAQDYLKVANMTHFQYLGLSHFYNDENNKFSKFMNFFCKFKNIELNIIKFLVKVKHALIRH